MLQLNLLQFILRFLHEIGTLCDKIDKDTFFIWVLQYMQNMLNYMGMILVGANVGAMLFQLPFRAIFCCFLVEDEQKSKLVFAHPPNRLKIALHSN